MFERLECVKNRGLQRKGLTTSDETRETILELTRTLGKTPVEVAEAPGFVVNRILIPMVNEAVGILADGVADAEGIDTAIQTARTFEEDGKS